MTIAFIPVRGGSKSIPLKNIRPLCGKPLVYWNIDALRGCRGLDSIVVATDSDEIEAAVREHFVVDTADGESPRIEIYRRCAENAQDASSTESVMLEYIEAAHLGSDVVFMLAQATSPLTQTEHFDAALRLFEDGGYDSVLSCVRSYRFYWDEEGRSLNYDYRQRPRRQDFGGMLMENGALYINTVGRIVESGNRLSGRIGIYEMPSYTATEIDEPDDWTVVEHLMRKYRLPRSPQRKIRLLLTDVDGVLTDAGMYYTEAGDELKKFNTRDGMAFQLLREAGIRTGIITSEETLLVQRRAKKLKADFLYQGKRLGGKLQAAEEICRTMGISLDEVAYVGDDVNCLPLLEAVGLAACPADAVQRVKQVPGIIHLRHRGGEGALRELVDLLLED